MEFSAAIGITSNGLPMLVLEALAGKNRVQAADYVSLSEHTHAKQKFCQALKTENVEQAWSHLKSWILHAAVQSRVT